MGYYVYKYIENNNIVYIGQTINLKARITAHKYDQLKDFNGEIFYTELNTKQEMDLIELILINQFHPIYNTKNLIPTINTKLENNLVWQNYKDFNPTIDNNISHEKYINSKNYKKRTVSEQDNRRVNVNKDAFLIVNTMYEKGIVSDEEAAKKLNIGRTSFMKIRRSAKEFFNDDTIVINRRKRQAAL